MKKRKKIFLILAILFIVIAIGNVWALFSNYEAQKENEKYGIQSYVKDVSEERFTVVIECLGTDTEDYLYVDSGPWHKIERRTIFGWVKLRCLRDSWTVGGVRKYDITEKGKDYELEVDYQWYYGDLRRGTYRVTNVIKTETNGKEEFVGYFYTTFKVD